MADRSFEVVSSSPKIKKFILPLAGLGLAVLAGILYVALSGSTEAPQAAQAPAQAAQAPASPPVVQVVAKDPSKQAELDQQLQRLHYFVANPTMNDANTTIQWLSQKFNQPPEVIVRDLFVLINSLQALSDADLAAFFNSTQNPWREDQGYNAIINFISYREYLDFVKKCAALYQTQTQTQGQTQTQPRG